MTAHDILTLSNQTATGSGNSLETGKVTEETPALLLLPHLLDSPTATVEVTGREGDTVGVVDAMAMLRGLGEILNRDNDATSWIEASVRACDFSASSVARAVEDADAHLLDMLSSTDPEDISRMRLSLKVSHAEPDSVIRSLERYGYEVVGSSSRNDVDADKARERLSELALYLNL